eukprot:1136801-Pelagomonas_calceolata.AAC.3
MAGCEPQAQANAFPHCNMGTDTRTMSTATPQLQHHSRNIIKIHMCIYTACIWRHSMLRHRQCPLTLCHKII